MITRCKKISDKWYLEIPKAFANQLDGEYQMKAMLCGGKFILELERIKTRVRRAKISTGAARSK